MVIRAVIFDMFETLITHYNSPLYMGKQIAQDMGMEEAVFREIWDGSEEDRTLGQQTFEQVIEDALRANLCYSDTLFRQIVERRIEAKTECFRHLHPEIIPMFETLKEKGVKIGLITNCYDEEKEVIQSSELYPYFDMVCMSCELGMKKPDARIYSKCVEGLSVEPEECLYVGDGGCNELEAARAMGMYPLQATWYLRHETMQPAVRMEEYSEAKSPMEVVKAIERWRT